MDLLWKRPISSFIATAFFGYITADVHVNFVFKAFSIFMFPIFWITYIQNNITKQSMFLHRVQRLKKRCFRLLICKLHEAAIFHCVICNGKKRRKKIRKLLTIETTAIQMIEVIQVWCDVWCKGEYHRTVITMWTRIVGVQLSYLSHTLNWIQVECLAWFLWMRYSKGAPSRASLTHHFELFGPT